MNAELTEFLRHVPNVRKEDEIPLLSTKDISPGSLK